MKTILPFFIFLSFGCVSEQLPSTVDATVQDTSVDASTDGDVLDAGVIEDSSFLPNLDAR